MVALGKGIKWRVSQNSDFIEETEAPGEVRGLGSQSECVKKLQSLPSCPIPNQGRMGSSSICMFVPASFPPLVLGLLL